MNNSVTGPENWCRALAISSALLLLGACHSPSHAQDKGRVRLEHVETAASGGIFQLASFRLENQSNVSIWFEGTVDTSGVVRPVRYLTRLECQPRDSLGWFSEGPFTGDFDATQAIEVEPNRTVRLLADVAYSRQYIGGLCRLRIELSGGRSIVSEDFVP